MLFETGQASLYFILCHTEEKVFIIFLCYLFQIRPVSSMESAVVDTSSVMNVSKEGTQNLTVQSLEMKESVPECAGTKSSGPFAQDYITPLETGTDKIGMSVTTQEMECSSLQPNSTAKCSNTITDNVCVIQSTISTDTIDVQNTVPFSSAIETSRHDQVVVNVQAPYDITEDTGTINNDASNMREIAGILEMSGEPSETSPLFPVGSVILDSDVEGCSHSTSVGELTVDLKTNDGINDGDVVVNTVGKNGAIHGTCRAAKKEGNGYDYTSKDFEKADEDDTEKPTEPCHDNLKDRSDINDDRQNDDDDDVQSGKKCEFVIPEVPVMVSQASQTDLEECIEDSDGLRFLLIPQKPVVTTAAVVSKPAPVVSAVHKTAAASRTPITPPRVGVRTSLSSTTLRPQASVRPAYAAVSRLSSPAYTRNQTLSHTSLIAPRSSNSPHLARSRTYADVMPARRGTAVRKLPVEPRAAVLKSQRPTLVSRQVKKFSCLYLHAE